MSKVKIAVLVSGSGSNLQSLIDYIEARKINAEIKLVISNKYGAYGLTRGEKCGITTLVLDKKDFLDIRERDRLLLENLQKNEIDIVVLAGYLAIIPPEIIGVYRNRIINIHPSLLPSFGGKSYYGERVHQEVIKRGVKITGATVHFVNEETDGGPIILQRAVEVDFDDEWQTVQKKVLAIEHEILPMAVKLLVEGKVEVVGNRVKLL